MRISFDLDDTLICYGDGRPCEPRLPLAVRLFFRDEPLRQGARRLIGELQARGHEVWVYTSSGRPARWIRWWLRLHGVRVRDVVDATRHRTCFGDNSLPTKRPHAFGIRLHVDNSRGVAIEGERYGFDVCVIDPEAADWVEQVLEAVASREKVVAAK